MKPWPVFVFQQVMPLKRLVQAMSPRFALLSYSSVDAESLSAEEPQARAASSPATVIVNGPSAQSSRPASEKSRSTTEQETESSSSKQVMFPVGERSSFISTASSGAGETGGSLDSSVSFSLGSSEGVFSAADEVVLSRW